MNIFDLTEDEAQAYLQSNGCSALVSVGAAEEIAPKWDDLARLHKLVRQHKPFTILEFGSGFSTVVMAHALQQNWSEYQKLPDRRGGGRIYPQPRIVSLESSDKWRDNTIAKLAAAGLSNFSEIAVSTVTIAEHRGQLCHFYDKLPDVVPDFVYLDGPDPATVQGSINGLSFQNPSRTVMSGDVLKYESTLLPGFFMIIDGRSNNARFLQRNVTREYTIKHHEGGDVTTFELTEPRLGRKNIFGWEAYTQKSVL